MSETEIDPYLLDKPRIRASFDRAAASYDAAAVLQAEVRARMFSRLELIKIAPNTILDAGCGTGHASATLASRYADSHVVSLDIAPGMLQQTLAQQGLKSLGLKTTLKRTLGWSHHSLLCADIEHLPLADASMSMMWSNLAVQWCNDLDLAFQEAHRVLQPEGLLIFSTFGPDTLKELRAASAPNSSNVHVSRFIDMHDIGDALVRAGFTAPVLDVERFVLTYDDVMAVMRDLKAIGAHNAAAGRSRGLQGKGFLQQLALHYEQFRQAPKAEGGKLPATFEVVYAHAWKPAPKPYFEDGVSPVTFRPRN